MNEIKSYSANQSTSWAPIPWTMVKIEEKFLHTSQVLYIKPKEGIKPEEATPLENRKNTPF